MAPDKALAMLPAPDTLPRLSGRYCGVLAGLAKQGFVFEQVQRLNLVYFVSHASTPLKLFTVRFDTIFRLMVCPMIVVYHLFQQRGDVVRVIHADCVENTNCRVEQFHRNHFPMGQLIVH